MASMLRSLYQRLTGPKSSKTDSRPPDREDDDQAVTSINSFLGPIEHHVVTIQCILIWEKPLASCLTLISLNILFWVIVSFQYRFYFVLALGAALVYFYQTWVNQIWPEIRVPVAEGEDTEEWTPVNPQVLSVPEISRYLNQMIKIVQEWWSWLFDLRRSRPGAFCSLVTAILVVVALIGHYVTGVLVAYAMLMTVMLGPGFMVHVYPHLKEFFTSDAFVGMCSPQMMDIYDDDEDESKPKVEDEDDFLPEPNEETLEVLNQALDSPEAEGEEGIEDDASPELGLDGLQPDESNDSLAFQAGLENLPSYDRDSDDDEFVDNLDATKFPSYTHSEAPMSAASIQFVSSHFEVAADDAGVSNLSNRMDLGNAEHWSESASEDEADLTPTLAGYQRTSPTRESVEPKSTNDNDVPTSEVDARETVTDSCRQEIDDSLSSSEQLPSQQNDADLSDFEIVSESEYLS